MLYVFENCRAFIRTVPGLLYSGTAPEDVDTSQEDHVADESRYFCMMRPIAPRTATFSCSAPTATPIALWTAATVWAFLPFPLRILSRP